MAGQHVGAVTHPEQERALRPVDVFVHLAGRMDAERARHHVDGLAGQPHLAAAGEAEVDFGRIGMAMVRADLPGLPARDGVVAGLAAADVELGEDLLDVLLGIPLLLFLDIECVHALLSHGGFVGIMPIGACPVSPVTAPARP